MKRWLCLSLLWLPESLRAQADPPQPVYGTFKGTRLYNFHTTEMPAHKHLEFRVAHRFGDLRQGYANFFGIDAGAQVRLSFGYSPLQWAEVGLERTGAGKWWDGYVKLRLLRQTAPGGSPVSVTWLSTVFFTEATDPLRYNRTSDRLEYFHQLLIARKFSRRFSLMTGVFLLHQNMALSADLPNTWFWIPGAARFKLTHRLTTFIEIAYPLWQQTLQPGHRLAWGSGLEIDTGGHVFQVGITSADGMSENRMLFTRRPLLRLGFNISRMFSFQGGPTYGTTE